MGLHLLEVEAHLLLLQVGLPEGREAALDQQAHLGLDAALVRVGLPRDAHQRAHKLADDERRRAAVVAVIVVLLDILELLALERRRRRRALRRGALLFGRP